MRPRLRRAFRVILGLMVVVAVGGAALVRWGNDLALVFESSAPSQSIGTTADGRLVNGKHLPTAGANFQTYSYLCAALGRNSVHGQVRAVVLDAYGTMQREHPAVRFLYGECSWPSGGRLRPHLTHRNGLSVDFMVPVKSADGPGVLKTGITNKFGYSVEFDDEGYCDSQNCHIDFDTMVASYLINPSKPQHNIDALCLEYLNYEKVPTSDLIGKGVKQITMREVPLEKVSFYACEDADFTLRLKEIFEPKLQKQCLIRDF